MLMTNMQRKGIVVSDRDNEDNYSRLDNQTPSTTSIAIGKIIKPGKKPNKKHSREDDKKKL
jgi:hypothetical protein